MRGIRAGDEPVHLVTDWSHRHLVFSPPKTLAQQIRLWGNVRYRQQRARRNAEQNDEPDAWRWRRAPENPGRLQGLWEEDLGSGATVGAGQYPAKYSFSSTSANCANATQPDFVVFNTSLAGSGTQATIVAIDNLYSSCPVTSVPFPNTYWAYNTGTTGAVVTSVSLSGDGTQVAFMQQVSGSAANLVLLKWAPSAATITTNEGTTTSDSPNVTITTGTVTASEVGLQISGAGIPTNDTIASVTSGTSLTLATAATASNTAEALTITKESPATPGVPPTAASAAAYRSCTAPCMYKITISAPGAASAHSDSYSSPFYDFAPGSDTLYVGDDDGYLYKFTGVFNGSPTESGSTWPVYTATAPLGSPVYDEGSGLVFVFPMYCTSTVTAPSQFDSGGSGSKLHSVCATTVCGTVGTNVSSGQLGPASGGCTGGATGDTVNMVMDAPIVDSTNETIYVVVGQDAAGHSALYQFPEAFALNACGNNGTMLEEVTLETGSITGVPVFDGDFDNAYYGGGAGHLYVCGDSGGYPTVFQIAVPATGIITDGTAATAGPVLTNTTTGCSLVTQFYQSATAQYLFMSMDATGTTKPANCTASSTGCIVSFNLTGATFNGSLAPTASANEAGGTSGIVIDNSSATVGASQIYFTPLADKTCTTSGGTGGCAIQAAQSGLN